MATRKKTKRRAPMTYAGAGVSIEAGEAVVDYLKRSHGGLGGFAGLATSPSSTTRWALTRGSGMGTADNSADV